MAWLDSYKKKLSAVDTNKTYAKDIFGKTSKSAINAMPTAQTTAASSFDLGTAYNNNQAKNYQQKAESYLTAPAEFKTDWASIQADPAYQTAMAGAAINSNIAEGNISAAMNRRGIMDSTITAKEASNAAQREYGAISRELIPKLIEDQYSRYMDKYNMNRQYAQDLFGVSDRYKADEQQDFNNSLNLGQMTGTVLTPEMEGLYNEVMQAKQDYASATTQEQKTAAFNKATAARARITALGGDASLVGADVTLSGAQANTPKFGVQTLASKQLDQSADQFNQNLAYQQGRDKVADQQWTETFAYQKARDAISDKQWQATFDENVRQYGLNYALDKLSQQNQQAYQQAQLALAQDDNTRAWAAQTLNEDQFTYQQLQDQAAAGQGKSASPTEVKQLLQNFQVTGQDKSGKQYKYTPPVGSPSRETWINSTVDSLIAAGYDNATIDQVLKAAGITDVEQDSVLGK